MSAPASESRHRGWASAPMRAVGVVVVLVALCAAALPTSVSARTTRESIGAGITGPSTWRATVLARGLQHVSALAEDDDGRIWAATATGETDGDDGVYVL